MNREGKRDSLMAGCSKNNVGSIAYRETFKDMWSTEVYSKGRIRTKTTKAKRNEWQGCAGYKLKEQKEGQLRYASNKQKMFEIYEAFLFNLSLYFQFAFHFLFTSVFSFIYPRPYFIYSSFYFYISFSLSLSVFPSIFVCFSFVFQCLYYSFCYCCRLCCG